jgi:C4-dicarboxylate transporter
MFKDLTLLILGAGISSAYFYWQQYKDKKEIKKQERLNAIKTN